MILARVGVGHLEEMKEMMKTDGFVNEVYPIILYAVVQMALDNPFCRLQALSWVSDVLKSCVDVTIPAMAMDWIVKSFAQIKAVELLPLVKAIIRNTMCRQWKSRMESRVLPSCLPRALMSES